MRGRAGDGDLLRDFTAVGVAPPIRSAPFGLVFAVGLGGGIKLLADPKQVMVFYAFRDAAAARRFRWAGPLLLLLVYACLFPLGFLARRLVVDVPNLETLIPSLVFEQGILSPWFGAIFIVALMAGSMSSLDSAYLVMASCMEKHVVAPFSKRPPSSVSARWILFAIATFTVLLSIRPLGAIIELTTFSGALAGALLPGICIGFTSRNVPSYAVILSVFAGVLGAVIGKFAPSWGATSPWVQDVIVSLLLAPLALVPWIAPPRPAATVA